MSATATAPIDAYGWFSRTADALGDDRDALEVGGERVSYARLRRLAERLAARLAARLAGAAGGTAPRRVGLLADRTLPAYAGYLAILRIGATVVPLNPQHPEQRLRGIAAPAGMDLLVTGEAHAGLDLGVPVMVADAGPTPEPAPPFPRPGPDDVAYIIFTSGSTGVPKGVPTTHRNLGAYLEQSTVRYDIGPGSRVSGNFELTFDGSVQDMYSAWARGGTLVVPQRDQLLSPVRVINNLRITHWFSVPSLISFADRLGTLEPGRMPTLRWSLFGGEPVPLDALRRWQRAAPQGRIEAVYGPTESTVICSAHRLPADPADWPDTSNGTAPIGTVFPNMEWRLVDEELCLRGPQLFSGYLDPAADAGRFLSADDGRGRWYRTGDRVSVQDGALVHLGRTDDQVKVRGHRIELGEIEAVLRQVPGVRDATVLTVAGDELAAAVTGEQGTDRLFEALGERLPAYMLPRRILVLDEMPLNTNGKVDRRSLLRVLGD